MFCFSRKKLLHIFINLLKLEIFLISLHWSSFCRDLVNPRLFSLFRSHSRKFSGQNWFFSLLRKSLGLNDFFKLIFFIESFYSSDEPSGNLYVFKILLLSRIPWRVSSGEYYCCNLWFFRGISGSFQLRRVLKELWKDKGKNLKETFVIFNKS